MSAMGLAPKINLMYVCILPELLPSAWRYLK